MAKLQPLVSVIVPCYKMGRYIVEALQSVASQSYSQWELIVVDDCGPEDGTHGAVSEFGSRFPDHRVEYMRNAENRGVSATRNTAIAAAHGDFLAFLDPDDSWFPPHLANSIDAFLSNDPAVAVVTNPVEIFWNEEMKLSPRRWRVESWKRRYFPESLVIENFIPPSATLVRQDALAEVGGFDVTPALQHIEDYDLWIRLADQGYRFVFLDEVTARYRKHDAAATADLDKGRRRSHELCSRHIGFFVRMQGKLIQDLYEEVQIANREITRLKDAVRNPVRWLFNQGKRRLTARFSSQRSGA